ncbi:hypothetical protein KC367_g4997 [Hortaea werneckii]|nr:hypothetical protein KC357_g4179 [Hortaea werneckii]KAI7498576.1 hypothetical protein KC367_g4997 [Hortaea werneckii]
MSHTQASTIREELARLDLSMPPRQDDLDTSKLTIVDTKDVVVSMLEALAPAKRTSNSVFVDMEGVNLSRHGSISFMQIFVPESKDIFIVDIHTLGAQAFVIPGPQGNTLKSVLEGSEIQKYFFDVRNDADALYALFEIRLAHVVDVLLLELASRTGSKHVLRGLAACVEQEQVLTDAAASRWKKTKEEGPKLFNPKLGGSYEVFNIRPLPQCLVVYCVGDVQHLPALSDIYQCRLDDHWKEQVRVETERRLTESRKPNYQPKGKKKVFGPRKWAFPSKSPGKQPKSLWDKPQKESSADVSHSDTVRTTVDEGRLRLQPVDFVRQGARSRKGKGSHQSVKPRPDGPVAGMTAEQDWALCDKDCGWCGHCGDGVL